MNTLIVGGTGMIGSRIAALLDERGHEVTLAARHGPRQGTVAASFPVITGDYTKDQFSRSDLAPFEAIVFAAGNDIRHVPADADRERFWESTQSVGVPKFAALAKEAGVERFVQIGSYYHQVFPELADTNDYVRARALADERSRQLSSDSFASMTLNPPSILGVSPGAPMKRIARFLEWADGERPDVPDCAPAGGTNYMSVRSLAEAVEGAMQRGEAGKAYLIGDVNWSFTEYFQAIFDAAGSATRLVECSGEHPMLPDAFIVQGRGNAIAYDTAPEETATLGYTKNDAVRAVDEMVEQTRRGE